MSPRWATTGVFAVNGAGIGVWVGHIPWLQERFDLTKGTMGLLLLSMSAAVILGFLVAGQGVARHGSVRIVWIGGIALSLAVILPLMAPSPWLVVPALFALGAASATQDVAMNSHGVAIENRTGRPIMSSLHAGWSLGGVLGAGLAAVAAALAVDPRAAVVLASALLLTAMVFCGRRLGPGSTGAGNETPGFVLPSRAVLLLAVLCLLVMVTEGAMADWGGIYLRTDLGSSTTLAALAFVFFSGGMTVGRMLGDRVNAAIGPVALLRGGALLTGIPLAALLLAGSPAVACLGLFLVGLGVANGVPLMFSAAGRRPGIEAGPGIAAVSSFGSLGFLAGPPLIGFLADTVSLPWALALLVLGAVAVLLMARRAAGDAVVTPEPRAPVAA